MIFQKTTFDRLFSINRNASNNKSSTHFGFESGGKRFFDVTIAGQPRIEQGMTVIALLKQPNSFDAFGLLGWIDCADGTIVCESAVVYFLGFLCAGLGGIAMSWEILNMISAGSPPVAGAILMLIIGAIVLVSLYLTVKTALIRNALYEVRDYMKAQLLSDEG